MDRNSNIKSPSALVSLIPLAVLVIFLALSIKLFGGDAIAGGSQLSLLAASAVCSAMAMGIYHRKWSVLEDAIVENMRNATPAIIILLMIGMIAGTWMASGIILLRFEDSAPVDFPACFVCDMCHRIASDWFIVDNDCHNRSGTDGNWSCARF